MIKRGKKSALSAGIKFHNNDTLHVLRVLSLLTAPVSRLAYDETYQAQS